MDRSRALAILESIREKRANPTGEPAAAAPVPTSETLQKLQSQAAQQAALRDVLNVSMLGLGAGAAGRSLLGLYNLTRRNISEPEETAAPVVTSLPYPYKRPQPPVEKLAFGESDPPATPTFDFGGFSKGNYAESKQQVPWHTSGMMLGGIGSTALGWGLVDKLLDARRRHEIEDETSQAEQEFQQALTAQYADGTKLAADSPGACLDEAFDRLQALSEQLQKSASIGQMASDTMDYVGSATNDLATGTAPTMGRLVNAYSIYALPAALASGYAAFEAARKRSSRAVLEKALRERRRGRAASRPTELHVDLEPVEFGA